MVSVNGSEQLHFREICPKDFYYAQILRSKEENSLELLLRLLLNHEQLDMLTASQTRKVLEWASEELLEEKILTVESWLETSFHLCKQRWDQSVDWLENQPISKIFTMIEIVKNFVEKQEDEMKKAGKRSK